MYKVQKIRARNVHVYMVCVRAYIYYCVQGRPTREINRDFVQTFTNNEPLLFDENEYKPLTHLATIARAIRPLCLDVLDNMS